jgi:hypothetical protein
MEHPLDKPIPESAILLLTEHKEYATLLSLLASGLLKPNDRLSNNLTVGETIFHAWLCNSHFASTTGDSAARMIAPGQTIQLLRRLGVKWSRAYFLSTLLPHLFEQCPSDPSLVPCLTKVLKTLQQQVGIRHWKSVALRISLMDILSIQLSGDQLLMHLPLLQVLVDAEATFTGINSEGHTFLEAHSEQSVQLTAFFSLQGINLPRTSAEASDI